MPRTWLVAIGMLVLGLWLPLAPGVHGLLDRTSDDAAHVHASGAGASHPAGGDHKSGGHGPQSPRDHDERECSVCVQLGLAKRAGTTPAASVALRFERWPEPAAQPAPARVRPSMLGFEGTPRAPPRNAVRT